MTDQAQTATEASKSRSNGFVRFQTQDVKKVAEALLEFGVWHENYGDCKPYEAYACQCCDGEATEEREDFKHELDCPILVAQDLLTGI